VSALSTYTDELFQLDDPLLQQLPDEAAERGIPSIHIPDEVGRLLQTLIVAAHVERILEIGTLFGYSSIWMARALPSNGRIVSLEFEPKHAQTARENWERAGVATKVEVREGPALEILKTMADDRFDLIFIDADKTGYPAYLDWALRLVKPGGLILADNTWRHADPTRNMGDDNVKAMREFNERIAHSDRLVATMIATRDGEDAIMVAAVKP
jgi:caffeoyl-CoA O-methyltransferase